MDAHGLIAKHCVTTFPQKTYLYNPAEVQKLRLSGQGSVHQEWIGARAQMSILDKHGGKRQAV